MLCNLTSKQVAPTPVAEDSLGVSEAQLGRIAEQVGHRLAALFQFNNGHPVTRHYFQVQLQKTLQEAGIGNSLFKTHSFRIGTATEAVASFSLPDHKIQRLGR